MTLYDRLFVALQYLWPQHAISWVAHTVARVRTPWFKNALIRWFVGHFRVDMSEATDTDPTGYETFNAFFTRPLNPSARPLAADEDAVLCPVDGTVSQAGQIDAQRIFQAKGHDFDLTTLLGGSAQRATPFVGGSFATLYLSPRDYHRIHVPLAARLAEMVYVPGRLFSVNAATTRAIPSLFARNERVVAIFETQAGPMAVVMVGAINVGSIETVWAGVVTPPRGKQVQTWDYSAGETFEFERGAEIGRFNIGSTVILAFGASRVSWSAELKADTKVRMGQQIGQVATPD